MKKLILIALAFTALQVSAGPGFGLKPIVKSPKCNGASTGSIEIRVAGNSTGPYTYTWGNNLPDGSTQNNISAGTYTVTVTDNNNASVSMSVVVTQPPAINLTTSATNASTQGGTDGCIHLNVTGGTPDFQYSWNNGATVQSPCGLAAGTYTVTVTDAFGCTAGTSKTIYQPAMIAPLNKFTFKGKPMSSVRPTTDESANTTKNLVIESPGEESTPELNNENVMIYPNPATNYLTMKTPAVGNSQVTMFNSVGQVVLNQKVDANETQLDISNFPKGNYVVSVKNNGSDVNKIVTIVK